MAIDTGINSPAQPTPQASSTLVSIIRLHEPALFRHALKLTQAHADACDLVQDTFVRAIDQGLETKPSRDAARWLFVVLKRLFVDRRRAAKGRTILPLDESTLRAISSVPAAQAPRWQDFEYEDVQRCLPRLDPRIREAYILHEERGLSLADTARQLRVPLGTAGTRVYRARRSLRALLCATDTAGRSPQRD